MKRITKKTREKNFSIDKRIVFIYAIVLILLIVGITYALQSSSIAFDLSTAVIRIDEDVYGDTTFNSSNLDFVPIKDSEIDTRTNNVMRIDFTVGGHQNNNATKPIIYDIALVDLMLDCEFVKTPYLKWKLVKNGSELSSGSFHYEFDTIKNGRLVLTDIQEDLPVYSNTGIGYHNYSFYVWLSDNCQDDLVTCYSNGEMNNLSNLMFKRITGKIEVELYTGSKKHVTREVNSELVDGTCTVDYKPSIMVNFDPNGGEVSTISKKVVIGEEYGSLPIPTKEGEYFSGWYTEVEGGIRIDQGNIVDFVENLTLYARWTSEFYVLEFDYTGEEQMFTIPVSAYYKLEAWGAQGSGYNTAGGPGAYVSGEVYLEQDTNLYIFVGGKPTSTTGGYNGGGKAGTSTDGAYRAGGGGTDFRLVGGAWNDLTSLASRIIVAAGGAGSGYYSAYNKSYNLTGGAAGGLTGYQGNSGGSGTAHTLAAGGTQTSGGLSVGSATKGAGTFGGASSETRDGYGTGGGGGYYGGGNGGSTVDRVSAGAGGSSYISGHIGCVAITSAINITPKSGCANGTTDITCSYHYSGKVFVNTKMASGKESQPTINGTGTQTGNSRNGYAKITLIGNEPSS